PTAPASRRPTSSSGPDSPKTRSVQTSGTAAPASASRKSSPPSSGLDPLEDHEIAEASRDEAPDPRRKEEPPRDSEVVGGHLEGDADAAEAGEKRRQLGRGRELRSGGFEVGGGDFFDRSGRLPAQPSIDESSLERVERPPVVDHAADLAPAPAHASDLASRRRHVRRVMDDSPGVDEIEPAVGEGEVLGIGPLEPSRQARRLESPPREAHTVLGQVHAGQPRARASEALRIRPRADSHLQDFLSLPFREPRVLPDERLA